MKPLVNPDAKTRYIVITGGVISGLGKGIVTASVGLLLKSYGYSVTAIKIDPYLNFDAGTMRPTEHGEVFVTFDGGETDQDVGTYERFLDTEIARNHNITSGQVFGAVIQNERNLRYNGKTVEIMPHVPDEIERRIREVQQKTQTDFVLIEIGGTIGDYQNVLYIQAVKQMFLKGDPFAFIHVVYLPVPNNLGEMKTKPAQHSIKDLNEVGIFPDIVVARAARPLDEPRKQKISIFSTIPVESIISAPDLASVYEEPLVFEREQLGQKLLNHFGLQATSTDLLPQWSEFVSTIQKQKPVRNIGIVGKYFDSGEFTLEDSYVSVIEAVKHAAWKNGFSPKIHWIDAKKFETDSAELEKLNDFHGIIVPGGFGASGIEGKIAAIRFCRERHKPFLGLCYGLQLAVIEFARNVAGMTEAHTSEIVPDSRQAVIALMEEQRQNLSTANFGNTMRLGNYNAVLLPGSRVHQIYGKSHIVERHRHRYEVNPGFEKTLETHGLVISGRNPERNLVEFIELPDHPFFIATQAHPEFKSRPLRPHPLFDGFMQALQ